MAKSSGYDEVVKLVNDIVATGTVSKTPVSDASSASSAAAKSMSTSDYFNSRRTALFGERTKEEAAKNVQSWLDRYNSTVNGFNDYASKAKDDWYSDYGENWYQDMLGVLDDWESIRKDAASIGYDSRGAYDDLKSLADSIGKQREYYASLFKTQEEYDQYREQKKAYEERLNYDLDAAQKEIADLKQQRSDYIRANVNDRRVTSKKDAYLQGIKDWDAKIAERENYYNEAKELQTREAMLGADLNALQREVESLTARRERYAQDHDYDWTDQGQREAHEAYLQEQDSLITQKKQYLNRARYLQEQAKLSGVGDQNSQFYDRDFESLSGYSGQKGLSQYINESEQERAERQQQEDIWGPSGYTGKNYDQLNEEEKKVFNYWDNYDQKYGTNKAQDYLDSIQETLNARKAQQINGSREGRGYGYDLALAFSAGIDQAQTGLSKFQDFLTGDESYTPVTASQIALSMAAQDAMENGHKMPKSIGGSDQRTWEQFGLESAASIGNMVPSQIAAFALNAVLPGAGLAAGASSALTKAGSLAVMGAGIAGNTYTEAINQGYSKENAKAYAFTQAASEMATEYLFGGIEKMTGIGTDALQEKLLENIDSAVLRFAVRVGTDGLGESLEEGVQGVLEPWLTNITLDQDNQVYSADVLYQMLSGFATAAVMSGPQIGIEEYGTYRSGRQLQKAGVSGKELADIGNTFSADTVAYKLAGKVNENTDAYTLGRLFQEIDAQITEANIADIQRGLENKGFPENTARKNAEVFASVVAGADFTARQIAVIESNEALAETVREVIIDRNSTVNQRTKGYNEVLAALAKEKSGSVSKAEQQNTSRTKQDSPGQANEETTAKASSAEKDTSETDTSPSVVKKISSIQDGDIRVTLQDGTETRVQDADIDPKEGVRIETVAGIEGITAEDANFILQTLRTNVGVSAQADALGAKEAYTYGYFGYAEDHMAKHGVFANSLTKTQREAIYQLGQKARIRDSNTVSPRQAKYENGTKAGIYFESENGVVSFQEAGKKNLSEKQEAGVRTAMVLNKMGIGGDIIFYESYKNSSGEIVYKDRNGVERKAPNGFYSEDGSIHVDLNAGAKSDGLVLYTMSHELTHFIEQWSPQKFKVLADFLIENYEKGTSMDTLVKMKREKIAKLRGVDAQSIPYKEAYSEVIADSMEAMLSDGNVLDKLVSLKARDSSIFGKMKQFFDNLAQKIRKAYEGVRPDSAEGRAVLGMRGSIERIQGLFAEALVDASENYRRTNDTKNAAQEGGVKYQARSNGSFDDAEIAAIQSIGRKSINSFNSSDIQKTESFARRYWKEMGTKSPFFRSWFGDWRVNEQTSVKIADQKGDSRGIQHNDDTGWDIQVSGQVFNETKNHRDSYNIAARPYLQYINDIVSKAILLDSFGIDIGKAKSSNSLLMHNLYAVADIGNGQEVLKLYVEEMNDPNSSDTRKRAYQLQNIEKYRPAGKGSQNSASPLSPVVGNIDTVADLFAYVNSMDTTFSPNTASKVVNADGTPMVLYHQTSSDFTIFDPRHEGAGTRDSDTPFGIFLKSSDKDIGLKGGKQMALYARITNPLVVLNREELKIKLSSISPDYAKATEELRNLNEHYSKKFDDAKEAWRNYMAEWRKENPDASIKALYDDERFNQLFDAEDDVIDEWEAEARKIEASSKEAITRDIEANGYDGIIIQQDKGSFGRSTDAYIALHPEQVKSATDNIGTFDGQNPDIRYSDRDTEAAKVNQADASENYRGTNDTKNAAKEGGEVRFSIRDGKLTSESTEKERYDLLKNTTVKVAKINKNAIQNVNLEDYNTRKKSAVVPGFRALARQLGILNVNLQNSEIDFPFQFSRKNLEKSLHHQLEYGGTYQDYVKAMSCFNELVENAVPIEVHAEKKKGTIRENQDLKQTYVLVSAFQDENTVIPVEMEVKTFWSANSQLYMTVALTKIDSEVLEKAPATSSGDTLSLFPESTYSLQSIFKNVNPKDSRFLKYVPDGFLNEAQKQAKQEALRRQEEEYASYEVSKHSDRDPEAVKVNQVLQKENAKLKEDVSYLKELLKLQRQVTGGTKFTKSSVEAAASVLMKSESAKGNKAELAGILNGFYGYIAKSEELSWDGIQEQAKPAVQWLQEHADWKPAQDYAYDAELAAQDLTRQVYESYWNVSTLYTVADVKQKQINRLKIEHGKRMDALKTDHKNAVAQLKAEHKAELTRVKQEYRQNAEKKQAEIIKRYQDSREKGIESRRKTAMRHKVKDVVNELNQYLLKGTKERHVPIQLQKAVAEALDAVNMDTVGAEERVAKLKADLLKAETVKERQEISRTIDRVEAMGDSMKSKLQALKNGYEEIINSDDPLIANSYDPGISAQMMTLIVEVGDTPLRDMSLRQLEAVHDVYTMVLTTVRNANKVFKANRNETVSQLGHRVMEEVEQAGGKKRYSTKIMDEIRKFGWNNLKPVYAFSHIGSKTLSDIFDKVRAGEDTWARDITDARAFYLEETKKYGCDSWDTGEWHHFTSTSGKEFSLNLGQIMSLYAYSKREQAADHLRRGGIVIDESTEITMKTKLGLKVKFNPTEATAYNISDETLGEIIGKLTPEQKAFVDEMQDYLSTTMGNKGNEVSLEMYGVKLFKEKNYFPLKSASQYMAKAKEQQKGEVKIKNSGFSNETVKGASNPIVLTPFLNVWASHVNEMSMYHSFVLPLEDFYRVYNYKTPTSDIGATESVEMYIQNAYGKGATRYIDQMLRDLNGGARTDSTTGIINKGMNVYKKGAVFANASVTIQQPSAIARATALVDLKYFIGPKTDHKRHAELWDEVKQYAPVAAIKEMGYFDTNMGKSTEDYLLGKEYTGIKEKAEALFKDSGYRDEAFSKLPSLADEVTWCAIWEACKRETQAKNPGMKVNSEEFLKKVGDRFTEVIVKTQVYDSVLSRSANMRSKDTGMKMATAFMAEPTTSINMVADAILKAKRGDKQSCRRAIGSVVAAQILNAFLMSWVYAARDDDDDESYAEKYIGSFLAEVLDGMNPLTYIPFIKDIVSIVQGYDVERSDISAISDLWTAWERLKSEDLSPWRKVEGFVGGICQIFGLPVKNIMRDVRAAYQAFDTLANGEKTTARGIQYAMQSAFTGKTVSNKEQLYEARLAGDSEHAARVEGRYEDEDSANAAVRAAIKEKFMDGKLDADTALRQMVLYTGMDASEAHWLMDAWKYRKEVGTDDGYSKFNNFYEAVRTGKDLKNVIKEYTDNGVGESTLSKQITEKFKPEYVSLSAADRAGMKGYLLNAYELCGVDREKAKDRLDDWDFEAEYGFAYADRKEAYMDGDVSAEQLRTVLVKYGNYSEEDAAFQIEVYDWEKDGISGATTAAVRDYNEYCAEAGVSREDFMEIRNFSNSTENDVDENGKKIAYSAMKKIMAKIDSFAISNAQKTALARSMGWKETNIQKYKLWD